MRMQYLLDQFIRSFISFIIPSTNLLILKSQLDSSKTIIY